jgi:hypothetical protein
MARKYLPHSHNARLFMAFDRGRAFWYGCDRKKGKEKSMAEIKSTLDLIMERTKNLTLTEEEKKAIRAKEVKSRVRGWFQRYCDGALIIRDLKENMERERAASPEAASLLREECLGHLEPEADNQKVFQVMQEILEIDAVPFQRLIDNFHEEMLQYRTGAIREVLEVLHAQGIGGTAVVPNLSLLPSWTAYLERARKEFRNKLYLVK